MPSEPIAPKSSKLFALTSVCVIVAALYFARDVMVPVAVALLFTFLLGPLVYRLERMRVPRVPAVLLVVLLAFAVIGGIGWLISHQATDLANRLSDYKVDIEHKVEKIQSHLGHGAFANAGRALKQVATDVASSQPSGIPNPAANSPRGTPQNPVAVQVTSTGDASDSALNVLSNALLFLAPIGQTLVILILVIFMLMAREDVRDRLIRLVGHSRLTVTTQALDDAAKRVSRYLLAQSIINVSFGVLISIGLYFIGIPNAALWGLLCAMLRFIPYVGVWIGAIFPIILSAVVPEGYYAARPLLTLGVFLALEITAANVAEPVLFGASTGVSPIAILIAAIFWTWLWGPVGLLLSTPLTVLLAVAGKYVPQLGFLDVLLGDQPVLQPHERYYQRLLADDPEEAEDLIEEFAKTRDTEALYTQIILPALRMTEQDTQRGILEEPRTIAILSAMRDHVDADRNPPPSKAPDRNPPGQPPLPAPRECAVNILCLPARGEADEIASIMIGNLLLKQGYCVHFLSADALASEMVDSVDKTKADLVIVSAMPPGAASHARYLCKRIHGKYPNTRMLVGLWTHTGDLDKARARMACDKEVRVVKDLNEAMSIIRQMIQPVLIRAGDSMALKAEEPSQSMALQK